MDADTILDRLENTALGISVQGNCVSFLVGRI